MRDVRQIAATAKACIALCNDGTVWMLKDGSATWTQLPAVPGLPGTADLGCPSVEHDQLVLARQEQSQRAIRDRFEGKR